LLLKCVGCAGAGGRDELAPQVLDRHQPTGRAVHLDAEVVRPEADDGPALLVHDAHVDGHHVDADAEHRRRLGVSSLGCLTGERRRRCRHERGHEQHGVTHVHLPGARAR